MKTQLKKLCIENISKNKENYVYSYELENPLKCNENQIKAIFENPKFKRFTLHFDFYRLRLDLTIYSKDQYIINKEYFDKSLYGIDIYLNEKQFFNFYRFIEKELKKNYENKSNLQFNNVFVLSSNKYQLTFE